MPPITIRIPTQAELAAMQQDPSSLLATWNAANAPKPAVGSPAATTAAGASPTGGPSNLNALNNPDWMTAMSEMLNQINLKAQQESNAERIPGATDIEKASSANIQSALAGNVPNDVYREMAQRSAERGVSTGSPMGASSTADLMRALGLTSLDLMNTGQKWTNEALARNPGAPLVDPSKFVTTPLDAEKLALAREQMMLEYNAAMAKIRADAARGGGGGASGYRLPSGGAGGGTFAPATNWSSGTPISQPWHDPGIGSYGTMAGSEWTPGTYTDQMNPLYGYTQTPGLPNTVPGGTGWQPPEVPGWDTLLPPISLPYEPPGGIDTSGLSEDALDWLYNVGG